MNDTLACPQTSPHDPHNWKTQQILRPETEAEFWCPGVLIPNKDQIVKKSAEQLVAEITEWANKFIIGTRRMVTLNEIVPEIEMVASQRFGQSVTLLNPRMEGTTLVADGFRLPRPIEAVHISAQVVHFIATQDEESEV